MRRRTAVGILAIAAAIIGGLAYSLVHSQERAQHKQVTDFARRASLTARLTGGAIASGGSDTESQQFGVSVSKLPTALAQWEQIGPTDAAIAVFDGAGRQLARWQPAAASVPAATIPAPILQRALRGVSEMSDIELVGPKRTASVWIASPFKSRYGTRVLASLSPSATLSAFAAPYLKSAPSIAGASAYLVDGSGRVVAASNGIAQGSPLPSRALARATASASRESGSSSAPRSGTIGPISWAAAPVRSGTDWRIVFAAPTTALLAPVQGSDTLGWLLFAAFVVALIVLLGVTVRAVSASGALAASRAREADARALAHERMHDPLTGLPNRALFLDRAELAMARTHRSGKSIGVLFADIDRFKRVNDSLGHTAGDTLLVMVAERLRAAVRTGDTVSRFGGDEFLVLCDDLCDESEAMLVASRISAALAEPFELYGMDMPVSCCIGIALHNGSDAPVDASELVRNADVAMYRAKVQGEGRTQLFDTELVGHAMRRLDLEVALRSALAGDELSVHYQPIVALPDGGLAGVEALARWHRGGDDWISPTEFIGLAEETGMITELGLDILRQAVTEISSWRAEGLVDDGFMLSVNVSPRQLADPGFADSVQGVLEEAGLEPSTLCLEITESAVVADPLRAEAALGQLSELGVQLAIDDFGVGLSSLRQLARSLQVDVLKLDQSFVANIGRSRERAVVAAVASMAGGLRMAAIAEGVERAEQREELIRLGYQLAQGFLFGQPVSAAATRDIVALAGSTARTVQRRRVA